MIKNRKSGLSDSKLRKASIFFWFNLSVSLWSALAKEFEGLVVFSKEVLT
jgi:hypothetical protein